MNDVLNQTAYLDGSDPLAHHICQINENNEIRIPKQIIDGIGLTNPEEIAVESVSDDNDLTVLFHPSPDKNTKNLRKDDDGHYWINLDSGFEASKPFDMANNVPHLFMSCGEIWVISENTLWNKLSVEVSE